MLFGKNIAFILSIVWFAVSGWCVSGHAQVAVDSSFGASQVLKGPGFLVPDSLGKKIGQNLFHSFSEFNLSKGQSVTFTGPDSIDNILGRVTGGENSTVDGLIRSKITGANLYLLNPQGFIFGENAKVDVDGAFIVSSNRQIRLGETGAFDAFEPEQSVLVSAKPEAFGFLGENPAGPIQLNGSRLEFSGKERSLSLIGGGVAVEDQSHVIASEGAGLRVEADSFELGDMSRWGTVTRSEVVAGAVDVDARKVSLTGGLLTSDTYGTGDAGSISIDTDQFMMDIGTGSYSVVRSHTYQSDDGIKDGNGGRIGISADKVLIDAGASLEAESFGDGNTGAIQLVATEIRFEGGGIRSATHSQGKGGVVELKAEVVTLDQRGYLESYNYKQGLAGEIRIKGRDPETWLALKMDNLAVITSANMGEADGGVIDIEAGSIEMKGATIAADAQLAAAPTASGGSIRLKSNRLHLDNYAAITSDTNGQGNAGRIQIESDDIKIECATIASNSLSTDVVLPGGDAGSITIKTGRLEMNTDSLFQRSTIASNTIGLGDGGNIRIEADQISMDGVGILAQWSEHLFSRIESVTSSHEPLAGSGGDVSVFADEINVGKFAEIRVNTIGEGSGGSLNVKADQLRMSGERALLAVTAGNDPWTSINVQFHWLKGAGGNLSIEANNISLSDQAQITAQSFSNGDAGNLSLTAKEIFLDTGARIIASTDYAGRGGSVGIYSNLLSLSGDSVIESASRGGGHSGVISLNPLESDATSKLTLDHSEISSNSYSLGDAGVIILKAGMIDLRNGSIGSSTRYLGLGGGAAGEVLLEADLIQLGGGSELSTSTYGPGDAGKIHLSSKSIHVEQSRITSDSNSVSRKPIGGGAGDIQFDADSLSVGQGGGIFSKSIGMGDAGALSFNVETLSIGGSLESPVRISTSTSFGDSSPLIQAPGGLGGNIYFETKIMEVGAHSIIEVDTVGNAAGGNLIVVAERLKLRGEGAELSGRSGFPYQSDQWMRSAPATGNGGNITIFAHQLTVEDDAKVTVESNSLGSGGGVDIRADSMLFSENASISAVTRHQGSGGSIKLTGTFARVTNGGSVESSSTGTGQAGSIEMDFDSSVIMSSNALITASSQHRDGGDIRLRVGESLSVVDSGITASAALDGGSITINAPRQVWVKQGIFSSEAGQDGGNLYLSHPETFVLHDGRLVANAVHGRGGNISIATRGYLPSIESVVSASSKFGVQGSILIETPDTNVGGGLVILPEKLNQSKVVLAERCALQLQGDVSSFFILGSGGLPIWHSERYLPSFHTDEQD